MAISRRLLSWLSAPLEIDGVPAPAAADAIVVLGAPLRADGSLSALAEERARTGVDLFRRGVAPVLCFVGGHCPKGDRQSRAEADGFSAYARAEGVPASAIVSERRSRTTEENALRAAEILLPAGRRRVVLVTQRFHLGRATWHFRRQGFLPLPHTIEGGAQETSEPANVLRWLLREYGAYAWLVARLLFGRVARG